MLAYTRPEYRHTLQAGLGLVLNGILLIIIFNVIGTFLRVSNGSAQYQVYIDLAQFAVTLMILLGYWRYTTPDPDLPGEEQASTVRLAARIAVGAGAACVLLLAVLGMAAPSTPSAGGAAIGIGALVVACAYLTAWLVQFFAIMTYTAWVASRIPSHDIRVKALRYRWLLPCIAVFGIILFLLGPLIALVLYWNLLSRLRKEIQAMR